MGQKHRWIGMTDDRAQVTLKRYGGEFHPPASAPENPVRRLGLVLDVETTGTDADASSVIEIGIRKFEYESTTGHILARLEGYGELQDPGYPIPPEITQLTGITDAMVAGKKIDWDLVNKWLGEATLVLAHNAAFDRPFVEKKCPAAKTANWGCTFKQINWNGHGFPSAKLEILSIFHGFFVDAHRALEDSDALLHLLTFPNPTSAEPYLAELLRDFNAKWVRVAARRSPFEKKDVLKARRYRWDQNQKTWYRDLPEDESGKEKQWLTENIYFGQFLGDITPLSSQQRLWECR